MGSLRIFIADDDERARRVLSALLAFHPGWQICGEAAEGQQAVDRVLSLKPNIAILDAGMPNLNGLEATRQIVQRDPARKVIVLIPASSDQAVRDVFHSGALGFVVKPSATHDLAPAIEAVQRGQTYFTPRFADMILRSCLEEEKSAANLSDHERETVRLLTEELNLTLRHQWRRPHVTGQLAKYAAFFVLALATVGIWWYELNGEPDHAPPAVQNLLMRLGLKSPPPPLSTGNPDSHVWIDVHTGLYYCKGDAAYGHTSRGRLTNQRMAQLDHFKPASGVPCK
jgi:DNA-binding NarL/FixJ family response regulator